MQKIMLIGALQLLLQASWVLAQVKIQVLPVTPMGSWQERIRTTLFEDGAQEKLQMKLGLIGQEKRGGEGYLWLSLEAKITKTNKKGKVKELPAIQAKLLVKQWVFELDTVNTIQAPLQATMEAIVQVGDENPVHYSGKQIEKLQGLLGPDIRYRWNEASKEKAQAQAGAWNCFKILGVGETEDKKTGKKLKAESSGIFWFSTELPFGFVKSEGHWSLKDKKQTWTSEVVAYGASGAESKITKEAKEFSGNPLSKIF